MKLFKKYRPNLGEQIEVAKDEIEEAKEAKSNGNNSIAATA